MLCFEPISIIGFWNYWNMHHQKPKQAFALISPKGCGFCTYKNTYQWYAILLWSKVK